MSNSPATKSQTLKLGTQTGSLFNFMMGNNSTVPVVGEGATLIQWTDRSACEVISISEDGRTLQMEHLKAIRTDTNGMSDSQQYRYEPTGNLFTLVWKQGAWRQACTKIWLTEEALQMSNKERIEKCYDKETGDPILVPGLTFEKKTFPKVNIIFGVKRAYHDYSF